MNVSSEALDQLAISPEEYALAVDKLGREPNLVELGIIGSLWSEHCSYKHSKPLLRMFPSDGERVLVEPGAENAGAVDIGDGLAVVMKIESHNHPSAIEPYEGAATGVGGIVTGYIHDGCETNRPDEFSSIRAPGLGAEPVSVQRGGERYKRVRKLSRDTERRGRGGVFADVFG